MDFDILRAYCLAKKCTEETMPFGDDTLVFKVLGKAFALTGISNVVSVNLKCDPERAVELRAQYPDDVLPGFHMNKKHWNTVMLHGMLQRDVLEELIDHSYAMVVKGLKKADRLKLEEE